MELITLFCFCFGIFGFFVIGEVIKIKKKVNKLDGIVKFLLNENQQKTD